MLCTLEFKVTAVKQYKGMTEFFFFFCCYFLLEAHLDGQIFLKTTYLIY